MIDTVIIDLDGPVLDGQIRHFACYRDILVEHGFTPLPQARYWEMKRNRINRREQLAATGADSLYAEFLDAWLSRIETEPYLSLDRVHQGVAERLDDWRRSGIRLLLVTMRHNRRTLAWQLDTLDLRRRFDVVLAVNPTEPDADKAAAVRPYLDTASPDRVLWIGDTEIDIVAARRVGAAACAVTCGLRTQEYLASLGPDFLVRSVTATPLEASHSR